MSFCVKCGKEGEVIDFVCAECFMQNKRFTTIADHVNLFQCVHCSDFQINNKWHNYKVENAAQEAAISGICLMKGADIDNIKTSVIARDSANYRVHLDITVTYRGFTTREELDTIVRLKTNVCGKCSKIAGNYYEATLQIRTRDRKFDKNELEEVVSRVTKMVNEAGAENREMFISKITMVPGANGGADINLSSQALGKAVTHDLAEMYGAEVKETAKLLTQKDGHDVFRLTFLVRLPAYRYGDVVMYRKHMYLVGAIRTTNTKITDIKTSESFTVGNGDMTEARVIGRREDMLDAVVLTETDRELQIMHPTSFNPVELRKPQRYKTKGETVKVFQYEEELYLLPK
jgi:nonsense-mediated mRNA decay protein 3